MSEDGASIDQHRAAAHPYVDANVLHQLRKIIPKESMALYRSSATPASVFHILGTIQALGSIHNAEKELDVLLENFFKITRAPTEHVITYTTRVQKAANLLRGTKHAAAATTLDVKRR